MYAVILGHRLNQRGDPQYVLRARDAPGEPRSDLHGDWGHSSACLDELATLRALDCRRLLFRGAVARLHRGGSGKSLGHHRLEHLLHLARSRPAAPCIDDCPQDN